MKNPEKIKQGKSSRAQGKAFENRVRADLEERGWIVDRWTNNIELIGAIPKEAEPFFNHGKLIPAKPHMTFNPKIKRMIPLQSNSGFPDFICYDIAPLDCVYYEVIGVECKMSGNLDKLEKQKCRWLIDNKIFSKILIAEKLKIKNRIVIKYHDFEEKYGSKD